MPDKTYPTLEDELGEGRHQIKVYPTPEFENKKPIKDSHKSGTSKKGFKWYLYQTKVNGKYVSLFANEKNKPWFDTGEVEVNIIPKLDKTTQRPIFDMLNGKPVQVLTHFVNEIKAETETDTVPETVDLPWDKK
jgi:hypothetical protein